MDVLLEAPASWSDRLDDARPGDGDNESVAVADQRSWASRAALWAAVLVATFAVAFVAQWASREIDDVFDEPTLATIEWQGQAPRITTISDASPVAIDGNSFALTRGHEISVPAGARATVRYEDGSTFDVEGGSRFRLRRELRERWVQLSLGAARFRIEPSPHGFVVATPLAEAHVVGTVFRVSHGLSARAREGEVARSRVDVERGRVDVLWPGHPKSVPLELAVGDGAVVSPRSLQLRPGRRTIADATSATVPPRNSIDDGHAAPIGESSSTAGAVAKPVDPPRNAQSASRRKTPTHRALDLPPRRHIPD